MTMMKECVQPLQHGSSGGRRDKERHRAEAGSCGPVTTQTRHRKTARQVKDSDRAGRPLKSSMAAMLEVEKRRARATASGEKKKLQNRLRTQPTQPAPRQRPATVAPSSMAFHAQPVPLPPTRIRSTSRISPSAAHAFLTEYLDQAAVDPAYQPDSTLTWKGPISANAGLAPNLAIHNLKRVQAGLAGEVLGRDFILEMQLQQPEFEPVQDTTEGAPTEDTKRDSEWQDLDKFEREQVDLVQGGDGEDEENAGATVTDPAMDADGDATPKDAAINKEERKRKKKERRKAEQRAKASAAS
ncbi:hypothetical protein LOZ45_005015 [Ophidiomyces ophidiicola]|nr:hypothetical protein LOZ60_005252 [Ophidiomyces ophidiicola]KAI2020708.1 hypothetical protein LOZ45_005015 [Ophidiomyces ophidiicola]KAI2033874.1 hypothetical protein LOZ48_001892 [Ophidiomyces ophidiicola]KAI2152712.1 hypothetical protein LOZ25_005643 [Ophidiomyces ophidiicola]KAI2402806.1 hypothetical protein LOZ67_001575 [Ophidiomyces ophidiicola]